MAEKLGKKFGFEYGKMIQYTKRRKKMSVSEGGACALGVQEEDPNLVNAF